ncbi:MAG TPA: helix-turn-helix transcriptional regulator [Alphaproteobacteria bacterium]|nr:helix-turn-helix transcriptional regulator [Alphaproteobacteria bacterium]
MARAKSGDNKADLGKTRPEADEDADYLARLGERVRGARARRGMARKLLARDSGVSERYLAQLESGQGNISILRLRRIAQAMGLPLGDLARDGPDRPVEYALIRQLIERLEGEELAEAHRLLGARFGRFTGAARHGRIALIGLRGAGKSTLGQRLARHLGVPFVDLGVAIEASSGMSLSEIFSLSGQATYRRLERRCLEETVETHARAVIETGGSLVSEPATYALLLQTCFTVWIAAAPEEHMSRVIAQGDFRPMAGHAEAMEDLRRILAERAPLYGKADATVDTAGASEAESFEALLRAIPTPRAAEPPPLRRRAGT